jgi:hypothetical protein
VPNYLTSTGGNRESQLHRVWRCFTFFYISLIVDSFIVDS